MRWERLFDDLEAQLEAAGQRDLATEIADRTRRELARIRLADRLRAARGHEVACRVLGAGSVVGRVAAVGPEWVLLEESTGCEALVPLAGLTSVGGLGLRSTVPGTEGLVGARLGLRHVLRGIARDRSPVGVTLVDGSALGGTVDRVGADFVEVAEHGPGEPRRPLDVQGVRSIPFGGLALVRRV
ncbi:MAG TPA: hypothetical protein VFR74_10215 [Jiangellales bacterium]|nr:hypothetical protein [Jiangellales bacterium]